MWTSESISVGMLTSSSAAAIVASSSVIGAAGVRIGPAHACALVRWCGVLSRARPGRVSRLSADVYGRILAGMARLSESSVVGAGADLVRARGVDALGVRVGRRPARGHADGAVPLRPRRRGAARVGPRGHPRRTPAAGRAGALDDRLRAWAIDARSMLAGYPGLARHLLVHWFESPAALDVVESLLRVGADAGLVDFACVAAENAVFTYVLMRVEAETSVRAARALSRASCDPSRAIPPGTRSRTATPRSSRPRDSTPTSRTGSTRSSRVSSRRRHANEAARGDRGGARRRGS